MKPSVGCEKYKDNLDVWYGDHRYKSKNLKEYVTFLKLLLDEIILYLAYICRGVRRLEGRQRGGQGADFR